MHASSENDHHLQYAMIECMALERAIANSIFDRVHVERTVEYGVHLALL